jgi:regulator of protease activity HflC (stomatin/prohibitin superfamily)
VDRLREEAERLAAGLRETEARRQESVTRYLEDRGGPAAGGFGVWRTPSPTCREHDEGRGPHAVVRTPA